MRSLRPFTALLLAACTGDPGDSADTDSDDSGVADTCEDRVTLPQGWTQTYVYGDDGRPISYGEDVDGDDVPNTFMEWSWSGDVATIELSYDGEPWWTDTVTFEDDLPVYQDHVDGGDSWSASWSWDDDGRMLTQSLGGWSRSWAYDEDGQVTEFHEEYEDYDRTVAWTWEDGLPVRSEETVGGELHDVVARTWTVEDGQPIAVDEDLGDDGTVDTSRTFDWSGDRLIAWAYFTADEGLCNEHGFTYGEDGRVASHVFSYHCGEETGTETWEYEYGCEGTTYARPSALPDFWEEDLGEALDWARRAQAF